MSKIQERVDMRLYIKDHTKWKIGIMRSNGFETWWLPTAGKIQQKLNYLN